MNSDDVLNNIDCIRVYHTAQQLGVVCRIASELELGRLTLIVVDSSIARYRVEYLRPREVGRATTAPKPVYTPAATFGRHLQMCCSDHQPGQYAVY